MTLTTFRYASTVSGVFSDGYLATVNQHQAGTEALAVHFNNNTSIVWAILANLNNRMTGIDGLDDGVTAASNNIIDTETTSHTSIVDVLEDIKGEGWETTVNGTKSLVDLYTRLTIGSIGNTLNVLGDLDIDEDVVIDGSITSVTNITTTGDTTIGNDLSVIGHASLGTGGITWNNTGSQTIKTIKFGVETGITDAASNYKTDTISHGLGVIPDFIFISVRINATGSDDFMANWTAEDSSNFTAWMRYGDGLKSTSYKIHWIAVSLT